MLTVSFFFSYWIAKSLCYYSLFTYLVSLLACAACIWVRTIILFDVTLDFIRTGGEAGD